MVNPVGPNLTRAPHARTALMAGRAFALRPSPAMVLHTACFGRALALPLTGRATTARVSVSSDLGEEGLGRRLSPRR